MKQDATAEAPFIYQPSYSRSPVGLLHPTSPNSLWTLVGIATLLAGSAAVLLLYLAWRALPC